MKLILIQKHSGIASVHMSDTKSLIFTLKPNFHAGEG